MFEIFDVLERMWGDSWARVRHRRRALMQYAPRPSIRDDWRVMDGMHVDYIGVHPTG